MKNIPVIPMIRILTQYAEARNIPLDVRLWESIIRCMRRYELDAQLKN